MRRATGRPVGADDNVAGAPCTSDTIGRSPAEGGRTTPLCCTSSLPSGAPIPTLRFLCSPWPVIGPFSDALSGNEPRDTNPEPTREAGSVNNADAVPESSWTSPERRLSAPKHRYKLPGPACALKSLPGHTRVSKPDGAETETRLLVTQTSISSPLTISSAQQVLKRASILGRFPQCKQDPRPCAHDSRALTPYVRGGNIRSPLE